MDLVRDRYLLSNIVKKKKVLIFNWKTFFILGISTEKNLNRVAPSVTYTSITNSAPCQTHIYAKPSLYIVVVVWTNHANWTLLPRSNCLGMEHFWVPLLNHHRSSRQISTIGEIDCPTPKRFSSPLTQNSFCILKRILSNNWCPGATLSEWPQVSSMLKKELFWGPINRTQIFNCEPKRPTKKNKHYITVLKDTGQTQS